MTEKGKGVEIGRFALASSLIAGCIGPIETRVDGPDSVSFRLGVGDNFTNQQRLTRDALAEALAPHITDDTTDVTWLRRGGDGFSALECAVNDDNGSTTTSDRRAAAILKAFQAAVRTGVNQLCGTGMRIDLVRVHGDGSAQFELTGHGLPKCPPQVFAHRGKEGVGHFTRPDSKRPATVACVHAFTSPMGMRKPPARNSK